MVLASRKQFLTVNSCVCINLKHFTVMFSRSKLSLLTKLLMKFAKVLCFKATVYDIPLHIRIQGLCKTFVKCFGAAL